MVLLSQSEPAHGTSSPNQANHRLLNNFQPTSSTSPAQTLTQTDLYTAYATRFSFTPPPAGPSPSLPTELAINLDGLTNQPDQSEDRPPIVHRLLDPVELITLTRMTFPECEPIVDEQGRFVIRGIARREGIRREEEIGEMFPFAAMNGEYPICLQGYSLMNQLQILLIHRIRSLHS
jgi:hypothetical protein